MNLLHISSSLFSDQGNSKQLADHFVQTWIAQHPDGAVTERDLSKDPVPHLDQATFTANITAVDQRTEQQRAQARLADTLVEELMEADVLVLSVPMYNFGIPSTLKAWIDNVARAGTTFKYTATGPVGLVKNTKAVVLTARGGAYVGTPNDTQTPYLTTLLGFLGITDVQFIYAERLNMEPEKAPEIINRAKAEAEKLAAST
ncbi:FMN-dependent NADH-azoreductase [Ketobacter sp. MCCC 1A13808]|uniref:FMN-dependent NADH-azoreductase n=1 Tax=Ketobacter sp. MCCC 1A13808 TaxID=2602738 RepID=UPI000F2A755A|nr:NAD(P)H-dependent oxidoreductase [Ketobacter sp. MCCC 1A13808]MVF12969.1 FMN-dependent NADH-azoreductase [Ketobacter sp. MCCC 1A13808]RLP53816.1 MAG: FMN-dependent NADH-azoreductase [Ketobacter sp.]